MSEYVLRGGEQGAARLALLARVKAPSTAAFFQLLQLQSGWRCLDVGCGAGAVTLELARLVQPGGQAVGVDRDGRCLDLARQQADSAGLPARFVQSGVLDFHEPAAFDLVYARFLLTHLPDPRAGLDRLIDSARPGGLVAVEDIDFRGHFSHPDCPAFRRYQDLYREVVRRNGGDADIGPRLPSLFRDSPLQDVHFQVVQPTFAAGEGKRLAAVTMEHIREAVVRGGLASDHEIDGIVAELVAFADDPGTLLSLPRIFQVWGRRPH